MHFRKGQIIMCCERVSVGSEGGLLGGGDVVGAEVCLRRETAGMCYGGLGHSMVNAPGCNTWVGTAKENRSWPGTCTKDLGSGKVNSLSWNSVRHIGR